MRAARILVVALLGASLAGSASALRLPSAPRCSIFPKSNAWNRRVDKLPVAASSDTMIRSIGLSSGVHADFGSGLWDGAPIGIPFDVVSKATPRADVSFEYADESDHVGYPIPRRVHIEGGSDHHALLVDKSSCRLYELGGLERSGGRWHAWAGAVWSLRSNRLRPAGRTSADAAGRRAEAVRDDPRRQRLQLVRQRRAEPRVVERPAAHARPRQGLGLRGRADASSLASADRPRPGSNAVR